MTYDSRKHHRRSIRIKGYDYSKPGAHFITICTYQIRHLLGKIANHKMILNKLGHHAYDCWVAIPNHFPNAILDEFIIMPNHIHGIIIITGANNHSPGDIGVAGANNHSPGDDGVVGAGADGANMPNNHSPQITANYINPSIFERQKSRTTTQFRSPSKTIGSIIRGFKIGVIRANKYSPGGSRVDGADAANDDLIKIGANGPDAANDDLIKIGANDDSPRWQRNYYDHIIPNEFALNRIRQYIIDNP
ncbi:hypothetical protein JXB12_12930, partial [candidate division KSB1 bacterium]|nr:hypothetical protein [candidate division KSB1 bacterium]